MFHRTIVAALILCATTCGAAWGSDAEDKLALGDRLMAQGNAAAALHFYDQAVALNENYWKIYLHRGDALMKLGERHYAIDDYKKVLQLYPGCPAALARLHQSGHPAKGKKKQRQPSHESKHK